jgi:uncharacterized protein (TIGR02147 family)
MTNVFEFESYIEFLNCFMKAKKKEDPKYSTTYYSRLIESSDSYLKQVLAGRRTLNVEKAITLAEKIQLNPVQISYFVTLVMKENVSSKELHSYFDTILYNFKCVAEEIQYRDTKQSDTFEDSLAWEIFSMVDGNKDFLKPEKIASLLHNKRASVDNIVKSIENLNKSIILNKDKDSTKRKRDVIFKHSPSVYFMYTMALQRSLEYLQTTDSKSEHEHFDSFCLKIDEESFLKIQELLDETRSKMINIVKSSAIKPDEKVTSRRLVYYNTSLFYVSEDLKE